MNLKQSKYPRGITKAWSSGPGFLRWGLAGVLLACPIFVISTISHGFDYDLSDINKPVILLVTAMMAAGAVYLFVVLNFKDTVFSKTLMAWVIVLGLLLRLSMFTSTPMLEDDQFRYMWDGGVLANGFNPYRYAPQDIIDEARDIPDVLRRMAGDPESNIKKINHPGLKTIYPPIAECAFALAHIIKPWSMIAWRIVLLSLDLATLYLLFMILRRLNLSFMGLVIYWWNPLLVKEIYNSGHMDVVIFPFVLGALLLLIQRRHLLASGAIGLAVGVKFWPALFLPVVLRPVLGDPKRLVPSVLLFSGISIVMLLPFYLTGLDSESGLRAYTSYWEMNDSLFILILWTVQFTIKIVGFGAGYAQPATRAIIACIIIGWTFWIIRRVDHDPLVTSRTFLLIVAALYLLSPTQYSWYYLWLLPFLAVRPQTSLLVLTLLLPLYYMRFYFKARGLVHIHDNGIVWLEFVPVWCLLIREWYKGRKQGESCVT